MKKNVLLMVVLFFTYGNAYLQLKGQNDIDSMLGELPLLGEDSNRVLLMRNISWEYSKLEATKGMVFAKQTKALAEKLEWKKGIALSREVLGRNQWRLGQFDSALHNHQEALETWTSLRNKEKIAFVQILIGQDYGDMGEYSKMLGYLNLALEAYVKLGKKETQGTIHNLMAWAYNNMGMYVETE